ncbi:hypothetical protein A3K64_03490, partial [Candidatus Micrarchaeota archaeon RBG_16_36_9]
AVNYGFLDSNVVSLIGKRDTGVVERVIDGDTIVVNGTHIRLLGINTPEKKELYYQEAKEFLEGLVLNKTIEIEYGAERYDKYNRTLAYLIIGENEINAELVRNGLANIYIYDTDRHTAELREAWNTCMQRGKNLCEKSENPCSLCIELKELDVKNQKVVLNNKCDFECNLTNWSIKDEGRKKFFFKNFMLEGKSEVKIIVGNKTNTESVLFWKEDYVWTEAGDSLFLRDEKGKLILWKEIER